MSTADELFSGRAPTAVPDRLAMIRRRTRIALLLTLVGPCVCVTSVPGAALAAWSWGMADDELQRVESGALPSERRAEVEGARNLAYRAMTMAFVLMLVQISLWAGGEYPALIAAALHLIGWGTPVS